MISTTAFSGPFGIMKRPFKILAALVLLLPLLLAIWIGFSPVAPRGAASVVLLGLTNNGVGQRSVVVCFTNASPVGVIGLVHSVDYKTAGGWLTNQSAPGVVVADVASSANPADWSGN